MRANPPTENARYSGILLAVRTPNRLQKAEALCTPVIRHLDNLICLRTRGVAIRGFVRAPMFYRRGDARRAVVRYFRVEISPIEVVLGGPQRL